VELGASVRASARAPAQTPLLGRNPRRERVGFWREPFVAARSGRISSPSCGGGDAAGPAHRAGPGASPPTQPVMHAFLQSPFTTRLHRGHHATFLPALPLAHAPRWPAGASLGESHWRSAFILRAASLGWDGADGRGMVLRLTPPPLHGAAWYGLFFDALRVAIPHPPLLLRDRSLLINLCFSWRLVIMHLAQKVPASCVSPCFFA
jgi:hypothetical protein